MEKLKEVLRLRVKGFRVYFPDLHGFYTQSISFFQHSTYIEGLTNSWLKIGRLSSDLTEQNFPTTEGFAFIFLQKNRKITIDWIEENIRLLLPKRVWHFPVYIVKKGKVTGVLIPESGKIHWINEKENKIYESFFLNTKFS